MDQSTANTAKATWKPHPFCPPHQVPVLTREIQALPASAFLQPCTGETFDSPVNALRRLNGYALSQGFAVVRTSGSEYSKKPYLMMQCVHHGKRTKNVRNLEDHVERDDKGVITTKRKQEDTSIQARDCQVRYGLSWKKNPPQLGEYTWVLKASNNDTSHSHPMTPFPLTYDIHKKTSESHIAAIAIAKTHREAILTYSQSVRVLEQEGFSIDQVTYYNLRRNPVLTSTNNDEFKSLVVSIEDSGFQHACRIDNEVGLTGEIISRQCQQVCFALPRQIEYGRRFMADFVLLIDGTFNTNAKNLTLIVVNGITNTGKTFPVCQSFARSEAKLSMDFIFLFIMDFILGPGKAFTRPQTVISDQAPGLIASLPTSLPEAQLQFCDWHAVANIMDRLKIKDGYTGERRDEVRLAIWAWIKASNSNLVETTRTRLNTLLNNAEIQYLDNTWQPKLYKVLRLWTRLNRNGGCYSNQRTEGGHNIIAEILHHNLPIQQTTARIADTIDRQINKLQALEASQGIEVPRTLDSQAFKNLLGVVTRYTLDKASPEWEVTKQEANEGTLGWSDYGITCTCLLLRQQALPCKHYLIVPWLRGLPIEKSLFHPRWWVNGPAICDSNWKPTFFTEELVLSPPRKTAASASTEAILTDLSLQALRAGDDLDSTAKAQYQQTQIRHSRALINEARFIEDTAANVPVKMIEPVPRNRFLKPSRPSHSKQGRALTSAEITEREVNAVEAIARREEVEQASIGSTIEVQPSRIQAVLLPQQDIQVEVELSSDDELIGLPVSTAPPRIGGASGARKRVRANTGYYAALNKGDSQDAREKRSKQ